MTEFIAIPAELMEDKREREELKNISELARKNKEAEARAQAEIVRNMDKVLYAAGAAEKKRLAAHAKLARSIGGWICFVAAVAGLAYIDAMAAWLAWVSATVWTGWLGYRLGKGVRV